MSFVSGGVTFQRFRVQGDKPRMFDGEHIERLSDRAAGRQRIASADGIEIGWTAGGHVLDTAFDLEKNVYPDHLIWEFRIDSDRLPPELLRAYYAVELEALMVLKGTDRPSARMKREAKEAARERLEQEAKDGRYKKRKAIPVVWDAGTNTVFFGASGATQVDRFCSLFEQTFGMSLGYLSSHRIAAELELLDGVYSPATFIPGVSPEGYSWIPDNSDLNWLGNEFLLWLWYQTDIVSDTINLIDRSEAAVMVARTLALECPCGRTGHESFSSEGPTRLPESRRAIRAGKLPRSAGLIVVRHGGQFEFKLQAETFTVSGGKLPAMPEDISGPRAITEYRLQALRDMAETIDLIYQRFLSLRLSGEWKAELANMQQWLRAGEAVRS